MEKPHRFLIDKVTSYAEEGAAFMRRRRLRSRPFARVGRTAGRIEAHGPSSARGGELLAAAAAILAERPASEDAKDAGGAAG